MSNTHCTIHKTDITAKEYDIYLCSDIDGPEHYSELFHTLAGCDVKDKVRMHINSYGGQLNTTVQIMDSMDSCKAHITTCLDGMGASAASVIFLNGDSHELSERSTLMLHDASTGWSAKMGNVVDWAEYEREFSHRLLTEAYTGFLTKKELKELFTGKDYWMRAEEIRKRLGKMIKERDK